MARLKQARRSDRKRQAFGLLLIVIAAAFLYLLVVSVTPHLNRVPATASLVNIDSSPDTNAAVKITNSTSEPQTTLRVVYTRE